MTGDEPSPRARELIAAARRAHRPDAMAKTRVRRSLDLRLTALAAGAVGGGTLLASTVAKAVAVATLAGAVVTGGVWVVRQGDPAPAAPAPTESRAPRVLAAPTPAVPVLEQELGLLTAAQQAMRDGAPERALVLLDRHQAAFPDGVMAEERVAARALALCELGRVDEARVVAHGFLAKWPTSPLARRMTEVCPPRHEAPGQRPLR